MGVTESLKELYKNWFEGDGLFNLHRFVEEFHLNSQGLSSKIQWNETYQGALRKAHDHNRPVMVVIHAPECRSCNSFRDWFSRSSKVIELSGRFSMVALTPDKLPNNVELAHDGSYVPRVIFLTPSGARIVQGERSIVEKGKKHFFPGTTPLVNAMKEVLQAFPS